MQYSKPPYRLNYKTQIHQDESMSSWLNRLARDNFCSPYLFCSKYLGAPVINRDIDRHMPQDILQNIAVLTSTPVRELKNILIPQYYSFGIEQRRTLLHEQLCLHSKIKGFKRMSNWIQFCPKCLKLGNYYRKHWRFSFVTTCQHHNLLLKDSCPNCMMPINFFNIHILHSSKTICGNCLYDLTESECTPVIRHDVLEFEKQIINAIDIGWFQWNKLDFHAFSMISGLSFLISGIRKAIFRCIHETKLIECSDPFCQLSTETRHLIVRILVDLMKDWPEELVILKQANIISQSTFYRNTHKDWPYWLWTVMRLRLHKGHYRLNTQEFKSAIAYLTRKGYRLSPPNLGEVLGHDRSFYINQKHMKLLTRAQKKQEWHTKIFHW